MRPTWPRYYFKNPYVLDNLSVWLYTGCYLYLERLFLLHIQKHGVLIAWNILLHNLSLEAH